ncbi:uncharacterized protein LOC120187736 [Hibiscus syriacus]|uniref:uncharacterized protein LOC120187736 n=1 Tax=Hibiscus syriacus TaxID=106335 RepID=UPI001921BFB6|nr:uncharacterized protein LOC120187736 [Hibiscus syriacus]
MEDMYGLHKLNKATKKYHFPLPFIDQMLDRLTDKAFYYFLDGYSRMSFGLYNSLETFQCCMQAIFSDIVEVFLEIFMEDFSIFGDNFEKCLGNLAKMPTHCKHFQMTINSIAKDSRDRAFDVWRIDFMGPFLYSFGDLYILLVVDYVSKWVEAIATPRNDSKIVLKFLHNHIFMRFGAPRAIISDEGTHFDNKLIAKALQRYGV